MALEDELNQPGKNLPAGAHHYRAFVGPPEKYDLVSAMQFNLLTFLGLREHHYLLDIGCGSLRGGKLFIPYLLPGRYFGIEPEEWLIEEGITKELGRDILQIKRPVFSHDRHFILTLFNRKFDFILAQSIFSHASQQQIRKCLSEVKQVMMTTSISAATFVKGEKNYTGDEWVYPDCVTYTLEHMTRLVEEQGLVCKPIDWPHPNQQTWIGIVYPGSEKNIPDWGDRVKWWNLEKELQVYRERLAKIEGHLYVKLGIKINRWIQRVRRWRP
jgi:hypothetical protein